MQRALRLACLVSVLAVAGCLDLIGPSPEAGAYRTVQLDPQVTRAYTGFGFEVFAELVATAPSENLFVSPTSAAFALAMAYNGAADETFEGMARTLGVEGVPLEQVNRTNREWLAALRDTQDPRVELALANSIWARQGFPFRESFYERNRQYYDAEVRELPFDGAALTAINGWVEHSTRGKIDTILDEIADDDVMFLINALYFKGEWRYRFDEQETRPEPFARPDGSSVAAPTMNQRAELPYLRGDGFQMVSLPYGNGRFSMVLALPDEGTALADFYRRLDPESWAGWIAALSELEVGVVLPRFSMESDKVLNESLKKLGMGVAFDPYGADFSEMTPAQVYIAFVRQKTFVEVSEEGTEAAAVTAVGMRVVCAGCGPEYPVLHFDRPFFFAIQDHATGTVLFLGQVTDPTAG